MEETETHRGRVATFAGGIFGGAHLPQLSSHYRAFFIALFSLSVVFSLTDLLSTAVALRLGLSESNFVLIAIANYLGLSILGALGLTKVVFIMGSFWAALYGVRTTDARMRRRALLVLSFLVIMLFTVSLNNLYWITSG